MTSPTVSDGSFEQKDNNIKKKQNKQKNSATLKEATKSLHPLVHNSWAASLVHRLFKERGFLKRGARDEPEIREL